MTAREEAEMHECIDCLWGVIEDVLPQLGRIALSDYERLNRGAILAEQIKARRPPKEGGR